MLVPFTLLAAAGTIVTQATSLAAALVSVLLVLAALLLAIWHLTADHLQVRTTPAEAIGDGPVHVHRGRR